MDHSSGMCDMCFVRILFWITSLNYLVTRHSLAQCDGCSSGGTSGSYLGGTNDCWDLIPSAIYACRGSWSVPGLKSKGDNTASQLCDSDSGYEICGISQEMEDLGLTTDICGSIDNNEFFASKQSTIGYNYCTDYVNNTNDIMGCSALNSSNGVNNAITTSYRDCGVLIASLSNYDLDFSNHSWLFAYDHTNELNDVVLTNKKYGGVLCCKQEITIQSTTTTTSIPASIPTSIPTSIAMATTTTARSIVTTGIAGEINASIDSYPGGIHHDKTGDVISFLESDNGIVIVIGVGLVILVLIMIIICVCYKNRKLRQQHAQQNIAANIRKSIGKKVVYREIADDNDGI